ncbi:MAG: hypothetical protein GX876_06360 [Bacteroidales bacterium]|nr:hypothetical protein [Bacteroidales bacterium]
MIKDLSSVTSFSGRKPTVVIDAGITTGINLKMLRNNELPVNKYGYHEQLTLIKILSGNIRSSQH